MNDTLEEVADGCVAGACNPSGILISLGKAIQNGPRPPEGYRNSLALKYIIGHINYLLGEALGPSQQVVEDYEKLREFTRVGTLG